MTTQKCEGRIDAALESVGEDFSLYMKYGTDPEPEEAESSDDEDEDLTKWKEIGSIYDYGLSLDYVEPGTWNDQKEGFVRYQFSWGGPSDEVRFYRDRTTYNFMDWFDGASRDISTLDWAIWLANWLKETSYDLFEKLESSSNYLEEYDDEDESEEDEDEDSGEEE